MGPKAPKTYQYERGASAVAWTRISDLCRALEMTPNDLFGVNHKMDGELAKLSSWTMKTALKLDNASPAMRQAIEAMLERGRSDEPVMLTPAEHLA